LKDQEDTPICGTSSLAAAAQDLPDACQVVDTFEKLGGIHKGLRRNDHEGHKGKHKEDLFMPSFVLLVPFVVILSAAPFRF
jgi:hypothetical protein